jgi:hypothetical protein
VHCSAIRQRVAAALVQKSAGRVVVVDGELRSRDAVICRRHFKERDRLRLVGSAEITDLDIERVGRRQR